MEIATITSPLIRMDLNMIQNELLPVPDEAREAFMRSIMLFLIQY
jgi:hypothetical protein